MSAIIASAFAFRRQVREEFQVLLEASYAAAEQDCNTVLLNRRGKERSIDPFSLFYGPYVRVAAYASRELTDWFVQHGRTTFAEFERQLLEPGPTSGPDVDTVWDAPS